MQAALWNRTQGKYRCPLPAHPLLSSSSSGSQHRRGGLTGQGQVLAEICGKLSQRIRWKKRQILVTGPQAMSELSLEKLGQARAAHREHHRRLGEARPAGSCKGGGRDAAGGAWAAVCVGAVRGGKPRGERVEGSGEEGGRWSGRGRLGGPTRTNCSEDCPDCSEECPSAEHCSFIRFDPFIASAVRAVQRCRGGLGDA